MTVIRSVFLDCDVIIDFLTARPLFHDKSREVFNGCFKNEILLFTSAVAISNCHYIISRQIGMAKSQAKISTLLNYVEVLGSTHHMVVKAFSTECKDVEDAIQYFTALNSRRVDVICSRNVNDFPVDELPVLTPAELVARLD